ncbi:MAG: DUF6273 domain-containing protein [Clostridia bacterium]|nr:DUF6273 domain-containing protein [Clostridia bacterium]
MPERLTQLMKVAQAQYAQGRPLLLEACALYKDNVTGNCIAQLKWRNIGTRIVSAAMVSLTAYDAFGNTCGTTEYQYTGLNAAAGAEFGTKNAIALPYPNAVRFETVLKAVSFAEGAAWNAASDTSFAPLPEGKAIPFEGDLLAQYRRDLTAAGVEKADEYAVQQAMGLWQCGCGSWQPEGANCLACGANREKLLALADAAVLQKNLDVYNAEQERLAEERRIQEEAERAKAAAKAKKWKKLNAMVVGGAALGIAVFLVTTKVIIPGAAYSKAVALRDAGKYEEAVSEFRQLYGYKDSATQIKETHYAEAVAKRAAGDWEGAIAAFEALGDYEDSATQISATYYAEGEAKRAAGDWDGAVTAFENACDYEDAATQVLATYYAEGEAKRTVGDWVGAKKAFKKAGGFKDSAMQISATYYAEGEAKRVAGDWRGAVTAFTQAGDYKDSATQALATYYAEGEAKRAAGDWDSAVTAFANAGNYNDSATQISETKYQKGKALLAAKNFEKAYDVFLRLRGYKDVDTLLKTDGDLATALEAKRKALRTVGNVVTFGSYEQDNNTANGAEAIEWIVLDVQGDKSLLIAKYGLDAKPYNKENKDITWEQCTLRNWLNGEFLNKAFTAEEQKSILTADVDNGKSQGHWSTNGGNNTKDKVFLLSYAESNKYFNVTYDDIHNTKSGVQPTAYAKAQGAYIASNKKTAGGAAEGWCWWLRSPGENRDFAALVGPGGALYNDNVNHDFECVRPALWLNLEAAFTITGDYNDSAEQITETKEQQGEALPKEKDNAGAENALLNKDADTVQQTDADLAAASEAKRKALRTVGNVVTFGSYEQDNNTANGAEPIEWIVLDVQGNKSLLISKYGLDTKPYNRDRGDVTWEQSTLRSWLNGEFLDKAFTTEEQRAILTTDVDNGKSQGCWDTNGGNDTKDKVFLLSCIEANKYFGAEQWQENGADKNKKARVQPTAHAIAQGAYTDKDYKTAEGSVAGSWWLRSPGFLQDWAAQVYVDGQLNFLDARDGRLCVRPAIWMNLEAAFAITGDYNDSAEQITETKEQQGGALFEEKDNAGAENAFLNKDADTVRQTDADLAAAREVKRKPYRTVGNVVSFGNYEQDNNKDNGAEPIEWIVLDVLENKSLLIAKYGLDAKAYNRDRVDTNWEQCTLRTWLNGDFLNKAFTAEEQRAISMTDVDNSKSQSYWGTNGGNDTKDKVFLLSYAEANRYFGVTYDDSNNTKSRVQPTAYAIAQGASTNKGYKTAEGAAAGWWWLRSPGSSRNRAAIVYAGGSIGYDLVNFDDGCVRPALWIDTDADIF